MYPHMPPYIHRNQQPNLEGTARRHALKIDKVISKSNERSGDKDICSRFIPGIYGRGGNGPSSTIGGTSSTIYGSSLTTGRSAHGRGYTSNNDYGFVDGIIDGSVGDTFIDKGYNSSKRIAANIDCGYISMVKEDDAYPPIDSEDEDDEGRSSTKQPGLIWDDNAGYGNKVDQAEEPQSVILARRLASKARELERVKEELHNAQMDYAMVNDQLRDAKAEIARLKQSSVGLDANIRDELETLGFSNVRELINSYAKLQDRVEVIERNFSTKSVCSAFLRAPSRVSVATERCKVVQQNSGGFMPLNNNKGDVPSTRVQLPMPDKFKGKTRAELERFFSLYEAGTNSKGWNDNDRAIYLGSYLPKMQLYHDSLSKRKASYQEMKQELLNALGSDGAVATFYLRSQLDRVTKPLNKSYKQLFEEVEIQVIEAFGGDTLSREDELKKILLRITDEDSDATYSTIVMTNVTSSYYKLKELVLALEASKLLKKKNVKLEAQRKDSPHKAYSDIKDSDRSRRGSHPDFQDENCRKDRQEDYQDFQDEDCRSVRDEDQDMLHYEKDNQQYYQSEGYSQGRTRCCNCQEFGHFARDCPHQGNAHNVNLQSTKILIPSVNLVGTVQQVIQNSSKDNGGRKKHEQASRQSKAKKVSVKRKEFELRDKKDSQQTHKGHTVKEGKAEWRKTSVETTRRNGIEAKADKSREGDTVVIGGTNAFKFARLIGVKHWSSRTLNDKTLHSKVAAENVKRLIYFPSGNLFFRRAMEFDAARDIFLKSLKQLSKLDAVEVIILPVFRGCIFVKESEMFYSWYNKLAKSDARLIAHHEQLYNWMEAKPRDSSHQYINANGIVTEDGVKRLCEYLIQNGFKCELRDSVKRNQAVSLHQNQSNVVRGTTHSNRGCRSNRSCIRRTWFNSNVPMLNSTVKHSRTAKSIQKDMDEYHNHQPRDPKKNQTCINKWGHSFEGGGAS